MITLQETKKDYLNYFQKKGYSIEEARDLLPPNKSTGVLFMICGGIKYDKIFRGEKEGDVSKIARIQNCLRTDNDYRVGYSPRHLTNFNMLEAFSFKDTELAKTTDNMIEFLTSSGIPAKDIFINIPSDNGEIANNAKRYSTLGIELRYLSPSELSWGIKDGPLRGQRMEVGHIPNEWELWNISYIDQANRKLVDSGMALERLVAVTGNLDSVFEIPEIKQRTQKVTNLFPKLDYEDACYLSDHIYTLNENARQGIIPSAKGSGNKMRHLIKKTLSRIRPKGNPNDVISLLENPVFEKEVNRIENNFQKGEREFHKYMQSKTQFDIADYLNHRKANSNSKHFDSPKLLNEELIQLALNENKKVILPDISTKELGKRYDIHLGLMGKLKN